MENLSFGQELIRLREEKSMSQRKLAEVAGVTNSTISRIEADAVKPDSATLEKIAMALDIDKAALLTKYWDKGVPEEFVILARKAGELTAEQRAKAYELFSGTIEKFLLETDDDEEE